ncbi:MAG: Gfo/Idh/MocA family oxidoreductase [Verrucomicrobia bacterium]|jgi:predicted dehydrogenase|nr:Gfo/Idh/MocA family oxidoreductase [Verrucomicrobiota bacterium]MDI9380766.1 Gfo/Idh/MocA family oxidoreductase [Verrucomicrobiota bacterium]NMD18797.1 Gfo/Idh/MocA family oxidoreductase [Verrucomicrobiota bacterium]HNU98501.1 Gfo/Idh/MocA family oxidoreductase [Verrucomicrobiota bacterium]HOA60607.1 Gfo/Idh/MocA family oxidoreductase [Verrucomicrobiota bacterium]
MNRRTFLQTAGLGAAGLVFAPRSTYAEEFADLKKRVGLIGTGWYGKCDLLRLIQVAPVEVVSLCDVDKRMVAEAAEIVAGRQKSGRTPRTYGDYRDMLKEKDLDIVLVGTPDHWHALASIAAMNAGADVWVQKPISVDVAEGQAMLATARKLNRVVQVGTQRRSTPHLIEARDRVLREGLLGKISHVDICCYWHMRARGNPPDIAPPEHLDYELWTGPAPMRPFCQWTHPRGWRAFMEYGNGIVGDMCIHMYDMVRWMLGLGWPRSISSSGGILVDKASKANISDTQTAIFDHGDLQVVWTHRTWGDAVDPKYPWSATFYGDKGTLKTSVFSYDFFPRDQDKAAAHGEPLYEYDKYPEDQTEKDLEKHCASAIRWHMRDFLAAIVSRGRPVADIEQGHISSASSIMANLSMQLGRSIAWDPALQQVAGDAEANRLLRRPYRAPWMHPEVES